MSDRLQIIDGQQGTHEWHQARLGIPTASKAGCIVTPTGKATANAARRRYALDLAIERITKRPTDTPVTFAMQRGTELEPEARDWYRRHTGRDVQQVGFCRRGVTGCSPDGLVGDDGCIEIKCPGLAMYCEIVAGGEIPSDWRLQCHHTMYVTHRDWCDFVLYTDVRPFGGWTSRLYRDQFTDTIGDAVTAFAAEVDAVQAAIIRGAGITPEQMDFPAPIMAGGELYMMEVEL